MSRLRCPDWNLRRHCVVLDTNVVLDLLLFRDQRVAGLAAAMLNGRVRALTDSRCSAELERVLGYPAFSLDRASQESVMRQYHACTSHAGLAVTAGSGDLPLCSDPDDQKFLELAWRADADLLTRDKALLGLRRRFARLGRGSIGKPEELFPDIEDGSKAMPALPDLGHNFAFTPRE